MLISHLTSRKSSDDSFFTGDRESPWFLVAFGMVGAALSGVTFVSVPGMVGNNSFYFFQFILGNVVGYLFITFVLIPLYYRLKLVSIYSYLQDRFGNRQEALRSYRRAIDVRRKLAFENPAVPSLKGDLYKAYLDLGYYQKHLGDATAANRSLRAAKEVLENIPRVA